MATAEAPDDTDHTWRYPWPAGERLLADLPALVEVRDRHVLDLGCGCGRLGLWALAQGARVTFCDGSRSALAEVERRLPETATGVHLLHHCWGEALPQADLLLGGDILYRSGLFPDLLKSIASARCSGLLSDPRHDLEPELPQLARALRLGWQTERRPGGYTLIRFSNDSG